MSDPLEPLLVTPDASIRKALEAIDRGSCAIALVVDGHRRLVGLVTDGDLRRPLLAGHALDDPLHPHVNRQPYTVGPEAARVEVLDLMTAREIEEVPVVDEEGVLVGLHVLREFLGAAERPNVAVLMAGGRGTRLSPITDELPKPMIPVAGRPILERLVIHLVGSGIREVLLAVNYKARSIEEHFGDGDNFGCHIDYLREEPDQPLGTAGALSLLSDRQISGGAPILVLNGDLVTQFSVGEILRRHEKSGAVATVGVREYEHEIPFGVIELDPADQVVAISEKPTAAWRVNAGIYALDPVVPTRVPPGREFPMTALIEDCLRRGEVVVAYEIDSQWQDIGRPEELRLARGER